MKSILFRLLDSELALSKFYSLVKNKHRFFEYKLIRESTASNLETLFINPFLSLNDFLFEILWYFTATFAQIAP